MTVDSTRRRQLLIVNNLPSHYRTFMFNTLAEVGQDFDIDVRVVFEARRNSERPWSPDMYDMHFDHAYASGPNPWSSRPREVYKRRGFNPGIVADAVRGTYDWVMFAPLMSPTTWALALTPTRAKKLLWSESNLESGRLLAGPAKLAKRALQRPFSALVCPGQRAVDYVCHFNPELVARPVIWLPNIVDTARYSTAVDKHRTNRTAIREDLGLQGDHLVILAVGQSVLRKGFHHLIEAAKEVPGDFRLVIVGDGPKHSEWTTRIAQLGLADRILMPGAVEPDDLSKYLAAADFFVHPALKDPSPLVCIEAGVAGLPAALSTQTGNAPEVVRENANGFTFDVSKPDQVVQALKRIVDTTPEERSAMGRESRRIAAERFSPHKIARDFFQALID